MFASRASCFLTIAVAALSLSACGFDCGTVNRTVANGTVRDAADVPLATAQANLSDNVGPSFLRLSVAVVGLTGSAGGPLRGHVTRARLLTEADELLAEIPTGTETLHAEGVVALNADLASQTEYLRVRSALLTGRAKVVLDTDLAGREHIETTLSDARDVPGSVGRCSPA